MSSDTAFARFMDSFDRLLRSRAMLWFVRLTLPFWTVMYLGLAITADSIVEASWKGLVAVFWALLTLSAWRRR